MAQAANLLFSERLLAHEARVVRERLLELAAGNLEAALYSDSLFGMYFDSQTDRSDHDQFLIFDFHRIILYRNSLRQDGPKIDSVVQLIIDDYPIKLLRRHAREQFHFLYPLQVLNLLTLLWNRFDPETVIFLDLSTGEIRASKAYLHPSCLPPVIERYAANCLSSTSASVRLVDRFVGPSLREGSRPELDDLVSQETGIVRRERIEMGGISVPCAISQTAGGAGIPFFCMGKALKVSDATLVGRCEALERYQVNSFDPQASFIYGPFDKLQDSAIDPARLCFTGLRTCPSDDRVHYESSLPIYWTAAHDLASQKTFLVPAQEIWFNTSRLAGENLCVHSNTNGCALGGSIEEAALFAILESIERDAFLATWYLRRPCMQIIPESISLQEFQWLWHRMQSRYPNYKTYLFHLSSDVGIPTVLCIAVKQSGEGHHLMVATACRLNCEQALFAALADVAEGLNPVSLDEKRARELLQDPEKVLEPVDHITLYSIAETSDRLSFLNFNADPCLTTKDLDALSCVPHQESYNLRIVLEKIMDQLHSIGVTVLLKDITHAEFRRKKLFCVKAITPGLYPMWFGFCYIRLALTQRLQRSFEDLWGVPLRHHSQLNLDVHPVG
ncbi:MAG TPA: YcaO-like family protein [Candidatus Angelobacter sp.]|jgi:ribosomal protein S12 methylthiotransferase accessory factor|nr:YcaO-like family protein [Candidatus Angelobacter sp.]